MRCENAPPEPVISMAFILEAIFYQFARLIGPPYARFKLSRNTRERFIQSSI
jgi:hypothetical protein